MADDANQQNRDNGVSNEERDDFFQQLKNGDSADKAKKQSIRMPNESSTTLELKVSEALAVIINSDGIDLKGVLDSGSFELKIDTNGDATINAGGNQAVAFSGVNLVGLERKLFKKITFSLKEVDRGDLKFGAKVEFFKGSSVKLTGTLKLNPMNGFLGPSLRRMKETSAGDIR